MTGCGTMFHNERVGQPHSRDIDWKVAGLNGLGLALFFVPGVVAFAVDFYTGAIYLPPEYPEMYPPGHELPPQPMMMSQQQSDSSRTPAFHPSASGAPVQQVSYPSDESSTPVIQQGRSMPWQGDSASNLQRVTVPRNELSAARISDIVSNRIGRPVSIFQDETRVSRLAELDRFATQCRRHQQESDFGLPTRTYFAEHLEG